MAAFRGGGATLYLVTTPSLMTLRSLALTATAADSGIDAERLFMIAHGWIDPTVRESVSLAATAGLRLSCVLRGLEHIDRRHPEVVTQA